MKTGSIQLTLGIKGIEGQRGDLDTISDLTLHIQAPPSFKVLDIRRVAKDCEILKQKLDENPKEMGKFLSLIVAGRFQEAQPLAEKLGLTEEEFATQEGGLVWLAIAVAAVILLWPSKAY
jgi:hypothetical protein